MIRQRTDEERQAYVQGWRAGSTRALLAVEQLGPEEAKALIDTTAELIAGPLCRTCGTPFAAADGGCHACNEEPN